MLSPEGCAARRRRLWEALPAPCEALVITEPASLVYYANYWPSPFVFNTVESAAILVLRPDKATVIADNLLFRFLEKSAADEVVAIPWYDGKSSARERRQSICQAALSRLPSSGRASRIGAESRSAVQLGRSDVLILDPLIRASRRTKDADELEVIRQSVRAGEAGHAVALAEVRPGMSELDVFLLVQAAASRALGEPVQIYGDFVSGPRCEFDRGGPPSDRRIKPCDLFLLDYSVVVCGYRADFTNTFVVGGDPTPRQRDLFDACMNALKVGESQLRAGKQARLVDAAVRDSFAAKGLDAFFPSHTGHGLGLAHPEPPFLVPESDEVLQNGDLVALEPGLYVPGIGGMRFERNYVITADGYEMLTHHHLGLTLQ